MLLHFIIMQQFLPVGLRDPRSAVVCRGERSVIEAKRRDKVVSSSNTLIPIRSRSDTDIVRNKRTPAIATTTDKGRVRRDDLSCEVLYGRRIDTQFGLTEDEVTRWAIGACLKRPVNI